METQNALFEGTFDQDGVILSTIMPHRLTVNPNTLWSYFHAVISVTACHMSIKLYTLT